MGAILVLDCYRDQVGGARNFVPHVRGPTRVVRAPHEAVETSAEGLAGIVITGSAATLCEPEPWARAAADLVRDADRRGVPVLGVCFGHQLIPWALIGEATVRRSPTPELGWDTIRREGGAGDPLLERVPPAFECFLSHVDEVAPDTAGLTPLARSARCALQAYRVGDRPIWGVQFHAEMAFAEARELVEAKRERPAAAAALGRAVDARPIAARILGNFERLCREGDRA